MAGYSKYTTPDLGKRLGLSPDIGRPSRQIFVSDGPFSRWADANVQAGGKTCKQRQSTQSKHAIKARNQGTQSRHAIKARETAGIARSPMRSAQVDIIKRLESWMGRIEGPLASRNGWLRVRR